MYHVWWPWLASKCVARVCQNKLSFLLSVSVIFLNYRVSSFYYCMWMTHRPNAITHTQEYTVLPGVVGHTFIIFGLFTTPNLCPLTQNPGDATCLRETPPQKRSGMVRVLKGSHSLPAHPHVQSAIGMSHTCLCLPSYSTWGAGS